MPNAKKKPVSDAQRLAEAAVVSAHHEIRQYREMLDERDKRLKQAHDALSNAYRLLEEANRRRDRIRNGILGAAHALHGAGALIGVDVAKEVADRA